MLSSLAQSAFSDDQKAFLLDAANAGVSYMDALSKWVYVLLLVALVGVIGVWGLIWLKLAGKGGNA